MTDDEFEIVAAVLVDAVKVTLGTDIDADDEPAVIVQVLTFEGVTAYALRPEFVEVLIEELSEAVTS